MLPELITTRIDMKRIMGIDFVVSPAYGNVNIHNYISFFVNFM